MDKAVAQLKQPLKKENIMVLVITMSMEQPRVSLVSSYLKSLSNVALYSGSYDEDMEFHLRD
jgi:hypothetical protein